jgi:hypothetical protein
MCISAFENEDKFKEYYYCVSYEKRLAVLEEAKKIANRNGIKLSNEQTNFCIGKLVDIYKSDMDILDPNKLSVDILNAFCFKEKIKCDFFTSKNEEGYNIEKDEIRGEVNDMIVKVEESKKQTHQILIDIKNVYNELNEEVLKYSNLSQLVENQVGAFINNELANLREEIEYNVMNNPFFAGKNQSSKWLSKMLFSPSTNKVINSARYSLNNTINDTISSGFMVNNKINIIEGLLR